MRIFAVAVVTIIAATTSVIVAFSAEKTTGSDISAVNDAEPALHVPIVDYRREWIQLGTFSVLADVPSDGAKELHVVYTERKNLEDYLKSGQFPDGTVLVKDVFAAKTESLTTGTASFAGDLAGRFVMVKDAANQRAGPSPLWGDGWGWAFYEGSETKRTVTTDYRADCLGCHEPARSQDLIFVQGYPILRNERPRFD